MMVPSGQSKLGEDLEKMKVNTPFFNAQSTMVTPGQ